MYASIMLSFVAFATSACDADKPNFSDRLVVVLDPATDPNIPNGHTHLIKVTEIYAVGGLDDDARDLISVVNGICGTDGLSKEDVEFVEPYAAIHGHGPIGTVWTNSYGFKCPAT